jgi:hypothetical protein
MSKCPARSEAAFVTKRNRGAGPGTVARTASAVGAKDVGNSSRPIAGKVTCAQRAASASTG